MGSRADTEARLIAATRELIVSDGAEGCSVEKICARAGFSRGAFYSNFTSKDELYAAVAEDEYDRLIGDLRAVVDDWSSHTPQPSAATDDYAAAADTVLMTRLLEQVLDALRLDEEFYIVQNELLVRSVRNPEWAKQFHPVNMSFVRELGGALEIILATVGRRPNGDIIALTHSVIGMVLRASCVTSWVRSSLRARGAAPDGISIMTTPPASEIMSTIVAILLAKSDPVRSTSQQLLGRLRLWGRGGETR